MYVCANAVLLNHFSTTAHFLGTTHQTAHYYIYSTYFATLAYDVYNVHFYTQLFILNDKITLMQYTSTYLQCSVSKKCVSPIIDESISLFEELSAVFTTEKGNKLVIN